MDEMTIRSRNLRVQTPIVFQPHCRRFPPSQPRFSHTRGPFILITLIVGFLLILPQGNENTTMIRPFKVIQGSHWDTWLLKTNRQGHLEWDRSYGGNNSDMPSQPSYRIAKSLVQTNDGGFALTGHIFSIDSLSDGNSDIWLVKTDVDGVMQWNQTYGESELGKWNEAYAMVQTAEGGYVLAGVKGVVSYTDMWLVKTDSHGQLEWNKSYGRDTYDEAQSMIQTVDGGYALVGRDWLVKVGVEGQLEWERTYGDVLNSIIQTTDGGYAVLGAIQNLNNDWDFWLLKASSNGQHEWNRSYGGIDQDMPSFTPRSIIQTSDGG
ncbi:MAG: hypothetical protein ACFFDT_10550, partial [Candidatus Hodarchaeota archaeon]